MKTTIYWFSGTGNSLAVARQLAAELGDTELVPVVKALSRPPPPADRTGLVFPVYAFGMPRIMHKFARVMPVKPDGYYFAVATMGGIAGGPHRQLRKILRGRGVELSAGWSVVMPGNYTPLYGAPSREAQRDAFTGAEGKVMQIADEVRRTVHRHFEDSIQPFASLGAWLNRGGVQHFRKSAERFEVEPSCTHCGLCAKVCPVGNIEMKDGLPTWLDKCEQCMACLQWCPAEAIQLGRATRGRRRYRHPDIKADDLFLR